MKYLLDTNTVSDLFSKDSVEYNKLQTKLKSWKNEDEIYLSILTLYELEYGHENAPDSLKGKIRNKIVKIEDSCSVLSLNRNGVVCFGQRKKGLKDLRNLKKEEIREHNIDIMLASTAIIESCTLVSSDKIYSALSGLNSQFHFENWLT